MYLSRTLLPHDALTCVCAAPPSSPQPSPEVVALSRGMGDAEDATAESYAEALLPLSRSVFVVEGALGLDTDAVQVLAGSLSAHGLGPEALALPCTAVCKPPRSRSSALFGTPAASSDIGPLSASAATHAAPQHLLPRRRRLVINWQLKSAAGPMRRRVTIDWVAKLLRMELAACVGGTLPRVLWQHF